MIERKKEESHAATCRGKVVDDPAAPPALAT